MTGAMQARAQDMTPTYASRWEQQYADELEKLRLVGEILGWRYEPFKLRLGKGWKTTYAPDFMVLLPDGLIELHEVKGFWREDARVKIKVAAALYPEFRFVAVTKDKNQPGWVREEF